MAWMFLLVAGLLEIAWSFTMKLSQGFTRATPTAISGLAMVASFGCCRSRWRRCPSALRIRCDRHRCLGAFVVGVVALGEPLTAGRVLAAALIVAGLAIMKLTASA